MPLLTTSSLHLGRHGEHALFVQASDEYHYTGRPFAGKLACRTRVKPPAHLLPVAAAARAFCIRTVQHQFTVPDTAILKEITEYVNTAGQSVAVAWKV
jgi:hypothetical protein